MRVAQLWRYPVKSFLGEQLEDVVLDRDGIPFDRSWAVWLPGRKRPLTAKREPLLFEGRARVEDDQVVVVLPAGDELVAGDPALDRALTDWLGYEATLAPAAEGHIFDDSAVHLLTTTSLRSMAEIHPDGEWDVRRFRPTVLVDGDPAEDAFPERGWEGHQLQVGSCVLDVTHGCIRCTMVGLAQSELKDDLAILEQVMAHADERLGVYATVHETGAVRVGDAVAPS